MQAQFGSRDRTPAAQFARLAGTAVALSIFALITQVEAEPRKLRHSNPAAKSRSAPDITATIPPKPLPPPEDEPLKPYYLPAAPRSFTKACGEKWQAAKMAGQVGDETWREFATRCLTDLNHTAKVTR